MQYRILFHPGHIRTYPDKADVLALAEFHLCGVPSLSAVSAECVGGLWWLSFSADQPIDNAVIENLYALSFVYVIFAGHGETLTPFAPPPPLFTPDMPSMLKYTGKTNELFTRMLINAARFSSHIQGGAKTLLDPLCGKGTALYSAAMLGMDATGIEKRASDIHDAAVFVKQYLEAAHCKYSLKKDTLKAPNGKKAGESHAFAFSHDKELWKQKQHQILRLLNCDTCLGSHFLKKNSFDCLAADLPYGVQHGAHADKLERNPAALLRAALPVWHSLLRSGAAAAVGWNIHVLTREALTEIFTSAGFTPVECGFDTTHRVSQAIDRDFAVFIAE